jgi:hypothetical protein
MDKLEFNPHIIDYSCDNSDYEYIAPGVKKYIAKPQLSLKDAIEKLSFEELIEIFEENKDYLSVGEYRTRKTLTKLYKEYLEPKGIVEYKGLQEVYHLVCEKIAMDWMNAQNKK